MRSITIIALLMAMISSCGQNENSDLKTNTPAIKRCKKAKGIANLIGPLFINNFSQSKWLI